MLIRSAKHCAIPDVLRRHRTERRRGEAGGIGVGGSSVTVMIQSRSPSLLPQTHSCQPTTLRMMSCPPARNWSVGTGAFVIALAVLHRAFAAGEPSAILRRSRARLKPESEALTINAAPSAVCATHLPPPHRCTGLRGQRPPLARAEGISRPAMTVAQPLPSQASLVLASRRRRPSGCLPANG